MDLTEVEKRFADSISELVEDSKEGWENYLEVYDENFESVSEDVNDSIGSLLANTALAIAEQKKLLQGAKTPSALTQAIKLIAVTGGNLMNAGASMLSWMGKQLPKRDAVANKGLDFLSWLGSKLPKRDDDEVVLAVRDSKRDYAIVSRKETGDFAISCGYDEATGDFGVVNGGFESADSAFSALGKMLKR